MSVSVLLYTSKTLTNGEHPIMIRLIKNRKLKYISIGQSSKLEWWDMDKQQPNRKHPNRRELEMLIDEKKKDARKLEIELEMSKPNFTVEEYGVKFRKDIKQTTVFKFFDKVIEDMVKAGRIGNGKAYKDAKSSLYNFQNGKDFSFAEMDTSLLTRYEQYMRERKVVGNTIGVYCRAIRAIYNKAIMEGFALKSNYPFHDFKVSKLKSDVSKRAIHTPIFRKLKRLTYPNTLICRTRAIISFLVFTVWVSILLICRICVGRTWKVVGFNTPVQKRVKSSILKSLNPL